MQYIFIVYSYPHFVKRTTSVNRKTFLIVKRFERYKANMTKAYSNLNVKTTLVFEPMPSVHVKKGNSFGRGKRLSVIGEEFETEGVTVTMERRPSHVSVQNQKGRNFEWEKSLPQVQSTGKNSKLKTTLLKWKRKLSRAKKENTQKEYRLS